MAPLTLLITIGCGLFDDEEEAAAAVAQAEAALVAGDLPGAQAGYGGAVQAFPDSVDAAVGQAYLLVLQGKLDEADALLARAEAEHPEDSGELRVRRALVALEARDLDKVKTHGTASGLAVGRLLAAEVALADGERDAARTLLEQAAADPSAVGRVAERYLTELASKDPVTAGLTEVAALWALGERRIAVRAADQLVRSLPDEAPQRAETLLLWAGRAASAGELEIAQSMLDEIVLPPEGQVWRKHATQAIILCARGEVSKCLETFEQLEEQSAPQDGLADARATAAQLIGAKDVESVRALARPYATNAAAHALGLAGVKAGAARSATTPLMRTYVGEE